MALGWQSLFFKGDQYIRYRTDANNEGIDGLLSPIRGTWPGLYFGSPDVVILYTQRANFYVFDKSGNGTDTMTTAGMFMVYRVDAIQNDSSENFTFLRSSLIANTCGEASELLFDSYFSTCPMSKTVPAHSSIVNVGYVVIGVGGSPNNLKAAKIPLHYLSLPGWGIQALDSNPELTPDFVPNMTPSQAVKFK